MRTKWLCLSLLIAAGTAQAGQINDQVDPATGHTILMASQGNISIAVDPKSGCNVYSIRYMNTEFLRQPETLKQLAGFQYGVPVLYPTPNRVRNAEIKLNDEVLKFDPNDGPNFLHGLVHSAPFDVNSIEELEDRAVIHCSLNFEPGSPWFQKFPFVHRLLLDIAVTDNRIRWTYTVDNKAGKKPVPYGFGLHPWFVYQGKRENTYLQIPVANLMQSDNLLPTGKIIDLAQPVNGVVNARQPISLKGVELDDVFYGMMPDQPAIVDFRDISMKLGLFTSANFTHLVVYTPPENWFCVENQTCSTDAHNLYSQGFQKESNLQIVETGGGDTGWVEYRFLKY